MAIGRYQPCGHRKTFFYCPHCHVDELGEEIDTLESSHAELLKAAKRLLHWPSMHVTQSSDVKKAVKQLEQAITRATEEKQ